MRRPEGLNEPDFVSVKKPFPSDPLSSLLSSRHARPELGIQPDCAFPSLLHLTGFRRPNFTALKGACSSD
jgi:hypothetical protein